MFEEYDKDEDNEVEYLMYLVLGHLCSGIIEENLDEDADHIDGEWHKVS